MKSIIRITGLLTALFTPALVFAATTIFGGSNGSGGGFLGISFGGKGGGFGGSCASSICGTATTILYIINSVLVPLLFAIAFIVFLYGVAQSYIFSKGEAGKVKEGHQIILWGVIGFAVMISLWGLVNVVVNTFGLAGYYAPPLPTSF